MRFRFSLFILSLSAWLLLTSGIEKFSHLTIKDGLSQSSVKCLFQDSKGYIWIGTADGLNRYDGYSFHVMYNNLNAMSISGNTISCIYENPYDSTLWIGTQNAGLNIYNRKFDNFQSFTLNSNSKNTIPSNIIQDLIATEDGTLWIATRFGGLFYFNKKDSTFIKPGFSKQNRFNTINCLEKDKEGNIWLGTPSGLYKWNYLNPDNNEIPTKINCSDVNQNITSLKFDLKGYLWIGTLDNGLLRYHPKSENKYHFLPDTTKHSLAGLRIFDILLRKNGEIWIGTNNGLCKYLTKTKGFEVFRNDPNNPESINNNMVYSLMEDKSGIIWIGTYLGGLNKIDPQQSKFPKFNDFSKLNNGNVLTNDIRSIFVDDLNTIWLGTSRGLVEIKNKNTISGISESNIKIYQKDDNIMGIISTSEGLVFSKIDGVFLMTGENKTISLTAKIKNQINLLVSRFSSAITDELNQVWFATNHGLLKYVPDNDKFELFNPEIPGDTSFSFIPISINEDLTGKIWLGTIEGDLYFFDKYTHDFELISYSFPDNKQKTFKKIFSLCTSIPGQVWLGTNMGLYKFNPKSGEIVCYQKSDGLPNNVIYGVLADHSGNIWCSTNLGVSRLNVKTGNFQNFTYKDGLQSNEFNQGAYFKDSSGKIYFGGINGLNIFNPEEIIRNEYIPRVLITSMEVQYEKVTPLSHPEAITRQISETKEINLSYKQNTFSFEFIALSYSQPERNRYKYALTKTSSNDVWINSGTNRIATFTNVPPGEYIFKVKGSNSDGVFNEKPTTIKVIISPPFWQTWWFRLLIITLVPGLLYLIIKYYRTRNFSYQNISLIKPVTEKSGVFEQQKEGIKKQETEGKELLIANSEEYLPVSTEKSDKHSSSEKLTLLLIENDKNLRTYIHKALSAKYNIFEANNAKTGIKLAESLITDLIICDVVLPDSDGFTVCKGLKSEFKTSHIPVILLTSLTDNKNRISAIKAGADAYITKPFDLQHLILNVDNLVTEKIKLKQKHFFTDPDRPDTIISNSRDQIFIKNAIAHIEENIIDSSFNVERLCEKLEISQPQCYRKIKNITGYNISEFIRNTRLKKAAKLLISGNYRINEVAYETGFNDPNYFTRCFTKLFGTTPSKYAKL